MQNGSSPKTIEVVESYFDEWGQGAGALPKLHRHCTIYTQHIVAITDKDVEGTLIRLTSGYVWTEESYSSILKKLRLDG